MVSEAYDRRVPVAELTVEPGQRRPVGADVRRRLRPPMPADGPASWLFTAAVAAVAALLRLVGLAHPKGKIFDEIYYATDAHNLLLHGVEWDDKTDSGSFIAHPPLGKWIIGVGELLFGNNETGWRIMSVVAGVVSVVILVRLARRMFRSTLLGCTAGLLMTLDGMAFVSSRVALLDIFLMMFVLAAFACLVMDREAVRARWLGLLERGGDPATERPAHGVPWWRLAAAVLLGAGMAVKWSAVWYILLFFVLAYVWDAHARRAAGVRHPWRDAILDEFGWLLASLGVIVVVYLAAWSGWFANDHSWDRHWLRDHHMPEPPVIGALVNLFEYHRDILAFHTGLTTKHGYQSWPLQWLTLARPVSYYYSANGPCGSNQCAAEVLLLGTPALWWAFVPALGATAWWAIAKRDWRGWFVLVGAAMGIVPWLYYQFSDHRTMFYFYALPAEPFLVLAVTMALGMVIGPRTATAERRLVGALVAGGYVAIVALCFLYFYPLYVGETIPYSDWFARMWLGNKWI
ncbi:dolichyl-phosphate-mannose--protein mannosyltransferase [Actinocatenispora rupis]